MTDNEILKALKCCASSPSCDACKGCPFDEQDICANEANALAKYALEIIKRQEAQIALYKQDQKELIAERDKARRECAVAEGRTPFFIKAENIDIPEDMRKILRLGGIMVMPSAEPSIEIIPTIGDFKSALLKKIFPYDTVDKKQYSINAYAVEKAIEEVAEQMIGG